MTSIWGIKLGHVEGRSWLRFLVKKRLVFEKKGTGPNFGNCIGVSIEIVSIFRSRSVNFRSMFLLLKNVRMEKNVGTHVILHNRIHVYVNNVNVRPIDHLATPFAS